MNGTHRVKERPTRDEGPVEVRLPSDTTNSGTASCRTRPRPPRAMMRQHASREPAFTNECSADKLEVEEWDVPSAKGIEVAEYTRQTWRELRSDVRRHGVEALMNA